MKRNVLAIIVAIGYIFVTTILAYLINTLRGVDLLTAIFTSATLLSALVVCVMFLSNERLIKDEKLKKMITYFFLIFMTFPNLVHSIMLSDGRLIFSNLVYLTTMVATVYYLNKCGPKSKH